MSYTPEYVLSTSCPSVFVVCFCLVCEKGYNMHWLTCVHDASNVFWLWSHSHCRRFFGTQQLWSKAVNTMLHLTIWHLRALSSTFTASIHNTQWVYATLDNNTNTCCRRQWLTQCVMVWHELTQHHQWCATTRHCMHSHALQNNCVYNKTALHTKLCS